MPSFKCAHAHFASSLFDLCALKVHAQPYQLAARAASGKFDERSGREPFAIATQASWIWEFS